MLISLKVNNCFIFNKPIEFSMRANKSYKRFPGNVMTNQDTQILKSAIVLGPNNTGKTMLTRCVDVMRRIMLNRQPTGVSPYIDTNGSQICELSIEFLQGDEYRFDVHVDTSTNEFVYEKLQRKSQGGAFETVYLRDTIHGKYECEDKNAQQVLPSVAKSNILLYLLDVPQYPALDVAHRAFQDFASRIDVVDTVRIAMDRTIQSLQRKGAAHEDIRNLVRSADLDLDDFRYLDQAKVDLRATSPDFKAMNESSSPDTEKAMDSFKEKLRLVSVYHGIPVPSIFFDSRGTQTIEALAGYIVDALREGRILVVDELDSGLHFRLTRAIVALFNNERNTSGQLIATTHDVMLLDCKRLFRKDQLWFTDKDRDAAYLYPLSEFTARADGIRDTTDLISRYKAGDFGALPEPDLFPFLMTLEEDETTEPADVVASADVPQTQMEIAPGTSAANPDEREFESVV